MKGMATCKICGRDFPLIAEERYTSIDHIKGFSFGEECLIPGNKDVLHDSFDCPHCGCQNVVNIREENCLCDECDHSGKSKAFEGCNDCIYNDEAEEGEHCKRCKHNYIDLYRIKEEK